MNFIAFSQCLETCFQPPATATWLQVRRGTEPEAIQAEMSSHWRWEWRAQDSRGSVEVEAPLVLDVEHQVSPIQELHHEEQVVLQQITREWNSYWCYPTIHEVAMCLQGTKLPPPSSPEGFLVSGTPTRLLQSWVAWSCKYKYLILYSVGF